MFCAAGSCSRLFDVLTYLFCCWLSRPLLIFSSTMSFGPDPSLCRRSLPSIFHHLLPRRTYVSFHHRRLCSLVFSSVRSTILDHDAVVAPQLGFVASLHRRFHIMAPSSSSLHHAFPSSSRRTYASHQLQYMIERERSRTCPRGRERDSEGARVMYVHSCARALACARASSTHPLASILTYNDVERAPV